MKMKMLKGQRSIKAGTFEYYNAEDGWRWRLLAANGHIIATGGESYSTKQQVIEGIHRVIEYSATVVEDRPEHVTVEPIEGRAEILCGCGTQILEEGEDRK